MKTANRGLVLVVDDFPSVRTRIRLMLESIGFHVEEAADGQEALGKLRNRHPELILLDLEMPVMDGISFLKALKKEPGKQPPVIVCSTLNNMTNVLEAIENGAAEYIMKPFDEQILFGKLELIPAGKP